MLKNLILLIFCVFNSQIFAQTEMKFISVGLNAAGDILIVKPNGGKSGFDVLKKKQINEIKDLKISTSRDREPVYRVPIGDKDKRLAITAYGRVAGSKGALAMTGDGFIARILDMELDQGKVITTSLQTDGSKLEYSSNKPELMPSFSFAFDPADAAQPSYIFKISRTKLSARTKINISFDLKNGTLNFSDNAVKGSYSISLTKVNADGSESSFSKAEISSKKLNRFQLDYKNWVTQDGMCLRIDDNGNGFADEKCTALK